MDNPTILPVAIVTGYMLLLLYLGWLGMKKSSDDSCSDYFLAGRDIHPVLAALTYNATVWSALVFLGSVGIFYNLGVGFTILLLSEMLVVAIFIPTVGKIFWKLAKEHDYITPTDLVAHRYGNDSAIRLVVALTFILFTLFFMSVQIVGLSYIMQTVTGGLLSYSSAVIVIGVILLLYVVMGGYRAVVWSDAIQVVMLAIAMIAVFFVIVYKFDLATLFQGVQNLRPGLFNAPGPIPVYHPKLWVSQGLIIGLAFVFMPQLWVRVYAVRDEKGLKNIVLYFIGGTFVLFFMAFIFAVAVTNFYVDAGVVPDQLILKFLFDNVPFWFAATLLTGAVAASMSTIDSQVLVLSSILTSDLYGKLYKKDTIKNGAMVGRIFSGILILFVMAYAFFPPVLIFSTLIDVTYPGLAALIPAVLLGLFWKKASHAGALTSILIGAISAVIFVAKYPNYQGIYSGFWVFSIALVIFVLVSLLSPPKEGVEVDLLATIQGKSAGA
jgi:SSS family solute:Na+ symporter